MFAIRRWACGPAHRRIREALRLDAGPSYRRRAPVPDEDRAGVELVRARAGFVAAVLAHDATRSRAGAAEGVARASARLVTICVATRSASFADPAISIDVNECRKSI